MCAADVANGAQGQPDLDVRAPAAVLIGPARVSKRWLEAAGSVCRSNLCMDSM